MATVAERAKAARTAFYEVVSFLQWLLSTAASMMMLALFCGSVLPKFGLPAFRLPSATPIDLMYYGIAWVCITGMIGALFKR